MIISPFNDVETKLVSSIPTLQIGPIPSSKRLYLQFRLYKLILYHQNDPKLFFGIQAIEVIGEFLNNLTAFVSLIIQDI